MLHATWSLIRFTQQLLMGAWYNYFQKLEYMNKFYLSNVTISSTEENDSPPNLFLPFILRDSALQQ